MKRIWIVFALCFMILAACAPSADVVSTAIAQTQAAQPTVTRLPTDTPQQTATATITPSPSLTPSPTPDLRLIDLDPRKLLLQKSDLPTAGKYFLPNEQWISPLTNAEIVSSWTVEEGKAYLAETGRIHGWWVAYERGTNKVIMPEQIYDNVVLYSTAEGAQLVVEKYGGKGFIESGYKEIDTPEVGDVARGFQYSETDSSGGTRVWLELIFSYRNIYHTVELYGWEKEVSMNFAVDVATKLIEGTKQLPLTTTVTFSP